MKPPLLLPLCHRLRDQAGDHAAISRALAESVCELEGALAAGVYLRDYAGETLFLAGQHPRTSPSGEEAPRLSAEGWDDPLCYCLHTGMPASFALTDDLPESVRQVSASPDVRSCNVYPIPELGSGGMGCVLTLCARPSRTHQTVCQYLCLYAGALLELARGHKQSGYVLQSLEREIRQLKADNSTRQELLLAGSGPATRSLREAIARVGASSAPLLITGETGTGKSLLARMVHDAGNRRNGPFLEINCGALTASLLESELFGHVKGAFSGAVAHSKGLLRSADGGTVFLDEIGEMPPPLQVALLQVLQEHKVRPVGGSKYHPVNMRIIAATNRDLEEAMQANEFRRDLYHRLAVLTIHVPPLRERREDILELSSLFLERGCARAGRPPLRLSPEAGLLLLGYAYPGNIRELEAMIEQAINATPADCAELEAGDLISRTGRKLHHLSLSHFREMQERWFIQQTMKLYDGDIQACSRALDVHPRTIRRRLSSLHI